MDRLHDLDAGVLVVAACLACAPRSGAGTTASPASMPTPPPVEPRAADRAAVLSAMARYEAALASMNGGALAAAFTENGEMAHDGQVQAQGRAAIRAFLDGFVGKVKVEKNVMTHDSIAFEGEHAVVAGSFAQDARLLDTGQLVHAAGTYLATWVRTAGGQWLMQRMSTAAPATPPRP